LPCSRRYKSFTIHRLSLSSRHSASSLFAAYEERIAEYHARRAEYHSRLKWLYVRAIFEFWAKIPYRSLDPPGLERPQIPYVPPPKPLVPASAKPDPYGASAKFSDAEAIGSS